MNNPRRLTSGVFALALGALLTPAAALAARPAPPPASPVSGVTAAALQTLEDVCRPSMEANVPVAVSATRLRYPSVDTPLNLPTGRPVRAWQAPGPGRIYVLEGGLPASAQASCVVAVYGEAVPDLVPALEARLHKSAPGFLRNSAFGASGSGQSISRFDRRQGKVVTSLTVVQPSAPAADAPSALIAVSRVDYGWMDKFGR